MTIKNKKVLKITGLIIFSITLFLFFFQRVLKVDSKRIDNFLIKKEQKAQKEKIEKIKAEQGEEEAARVSESVKKIKNSKLQTENKPESAPSNIYNSRDYMKTRESINAINRIALWIRSRSASEIDDPSDSEDSTLSKIFFWTSIISPSAFDNIFNLDSDSAYYAFIDAMYDPDIRWEAKYFITQIMGEKGERRTLPLFREIITDNNEALLLRVTAIDQIRSMQDKDSSDHVLKLLDDESPIMRNKASATLRDTAELQDEHVYEKVLTQYFEEEDLNARLCMLGTAMFIGKEQSLNDAEEIIKTATQLEKEIIAMGLGDIPTHESFKILKELYDPGNKDLTILVTASMAKINIDEANEFLYNVVSQANGIISIMAADDLLEYQRIEAIPYVQEALNKEHNPEFINDYQEILNQLRQN